VGDAPSTTAFWDALHQPVSPADVRDIDVQLVAHIASAKAHGLPDSDVSGWLSYLAGRCDGPDVATWVGRVESESVVLAYNCANGDDAALRRFESVYLGEVDVGASRLSCTDAELDEIRQAVRNALFGPGDDGRPKVLGMTVRGDLRALIRLMALRAGITLRRSRGRQPPQGEDALAALSDGAQTPSLALVKAEHRAQFRQALEAAVDTLDARSRTLLRMYEIDGVGQAQLATMHRVDRSTVARWLARARRDVLSATRRELADRFDVRHANFDSFIDVIRSNFEASVMRLLQAPNPTQS